MIRNEALGMSAAGIATALPFGAVCLLSRRLFDQRCRDEPVGGAILTMLILALIVQVGIWTCGPCGVRGGCSTAVLGLFTYPFIALPAGAVAYLLVDQYAHGHEM